jgi:ferredoxin
MNITVDVITCQAYANCIVEAPDVFDLDESGKVFVLLGQVDESRRDEVLRAADCCPVRAITLAD